MNGFQKFLCLVDRHEECHFSILQFFCSGHFLIIFPKVKDQKMTGAKKVVNMKNHIFHACQPREGIFEIRS